MARTKQKKTPLSPSPSQQQSKAESEGEEATGGMLLGKEDIQLIYKALREYTPMEKEVHLHGILVEEFEELLATEYIVVGAKLGMRPEYCRGQLAKPVDAHTRPGCHNGGKL
jgi:hypothetical protein